MKNITKIVAGLGVVAGLGAAMLPLGTYAANSKDVQLKVTVGSILTLEEDAANSTKELNLGLGAADSTSLKSAFKVSTNNAGGYDVTVKGKEASADMVNGSNTIPAQSGLPVAGTAGWALKDASGNWVAANGNAGTAVTVKSNGAAAFEDPFTTNYAVATSGTQAPGDYVVDLVFTATAK